MPVEGVSVYPIAVVSLMAAHILCTVLGIGGSTVPKQIASGALVIGGLVYSAIANILHTSREGARSYVVQ